MNGETKEWQSYFDDAGRRHWRWPALPTGNAQDGSARRTPSRIAEEPQQVPLLPLRVRSR